MSNARTLPLPYSPVSILATIVGMLVVVYLGLIAVVMSYAAHTIEFAQSSRANEAVVAQLEARYLARVAEITNTDYASHGYVKPIAQTFVSSRSGTALR